MFFVYVSFLYVDIEFFEMNFFLYNNQLSYVICIRGNVYFLYQYNVRVYYNKEEVVRYKYSFVYLFEQVSLLVVDFFLVCWVI